jgi:hypothetical protein
MRPVSEATARVTGQSFSRKYISLGRIVNCWNEIVGKDLAGKAQPVKINYRKKDRREKPEASLDIAANPSVATLLHYQKDLIIERINQIFGERWITAIRFVAVPANQDRPRHDIKRIPLTGEEKNILSGMLQAVPDPDIRQRLESLGQEIMMAGKTSRSGAI